MWQLINALTDAHLWADTYDRKLYGYFRGRERARKNPSRRRCKQTQGGSEKPRSQKPDGVKSALPYELYLKGRFFSGTSGPGTILRAITIVYLTASVAKDPATRWRKMPLPAIRRASSVFYWGASPDESIVGRQQLRRRRRWSGHFVASHASLVLIATEELERQSRSERTGARGSIKLRITPPHTTGLSLAAVLHTALGAIVIGPGCGIETRAPA